MNKRLIIVFILGIIACTTCAQVKHLTLPQLNKRINNSDTVFIINFWATWCKPCIAELPVFDKLQLTYKNQPLKVLLVSMDFESALVAVKNFVATHQLHSEVFLAARKSDEELINGIDKAWSGALPGTLIVNYKKAIRKFYEREFTYSQLKALYQTIK